MEMVSKRSCPISLKKHTGLIVGVTIQHKLALFYRSHYPIFSSSHCLLLITLRVVPYEIASNVRSFDFAHLGNHGFHRLSCSAELTIFTSSVIVFHC